MKAVSILIPVYNDNIVWQVTMLRNQCKAIDGLQWEIVVADDGSSEEYLRRNRPLLSMEGCRFIVRGQDYGRAANRNFLAQQARYDTLLYIDSGLKPNPHFVENYVNNVDKAEVVCGNIAVDPDHVDMANLRCRNELKAQQRFTAERHAMDPYKNFHTGNFMIQRRVMLAHPLREDIKTYGYEDTLFGKDLSIKGVSIRHIENPVMFVRFESNTRYVEKTREAIVTLYNYRHELEGYSPLLHLACLAGRYHLAGAVRLFHSLFGRMMEANLESRHPNLHVFSIYRLCLLVNMIYFSNFTS